MRGVNIPIISLTVVVVAACYSLDVPKSAVNNCTVSAVINAGVGTADFRQRIPKQTAVAPADSVLDVVLTFATAVTQVDRDAIATAGGMNISTAGTATSLKAQFRASDLASYVAADTGRLTNAVIYIPACFTS